MLNYLEEAQKRAMLARALRTGSFPSGGEVSRAPMPNNTAQQPQQQSQQQSTDMGNNIGKILGSYNSGGINPTPAGSGLAGSGDPGMGVSAGARGHGLYGAGSTPGTGVNGSAAPSWWSNMFGSSSAGAGSSGAGAAPAGASGSGGMGAGGWWAALAAVIAANEHEARAAGARRDGADYRKDLVSGAVLGQDVEKRWRPWLDDHTGGFSEKSGLGKDMQFGVDAGTPGGWKNVVSDYKGTTADKINSNSWDFTKKSLNPFKLFS